MASFEVLHHTGTESGIDWVDVTLGILVLLVLVAIGFGIAKLIKSRRGD